MPAAVTRRLPGALVLCFAISIEGCKKGEDSKDSTNVSQSGGVKAATDTTGAPQAQQALPVTVELARDADLVLSIVTTGSVRSEAQSQLRFETPGVVDRVLVRPGQRVNKGDVLATLDSVPFVLALKRAELGVQSAQLTYQDLMVDSAAFGRAPSAERRRNALTRSGLDNANLTLQQAVLDRQRSVLRAPFEGVIDRMDCTEGERSDAGNSSITLVDLQRLRIEASVLEHDIPLIREGGDAIVSTAASPDVLSHGHIVAVLPIIDSISRAGRAYVQLTGNGVLRPGMSVDVQLEAKRLTNRRVVPARAVIERDGRPLVFVVRNDRAQWVYIQPGRSNRFETEVLPDSITHEIPIKAGDQVIVIGQLTLGHDAPVKVVKAEPTKR